MRIRTGIILFILIALVGNAGPSMAQSARDLFFEGNDYMKEGNLEEAKAAYLESIALNPKIPMVHFNLGLVYKKMRDYPAAAGSLEEVLKLDPNHLDARVTIGNVYNYMEEWSKAISHLNFVVHRRPNDPEAHGNLGWALLNYNEGPPFKYLVIVNLAKAVELFDQQGMSGPAEATRKTLEDALEKFGKDYQDRFGSKQP